MSGKRVKTKGQIKKRMIRAAKKQNIFFNNKNKWFVKKRKT